MERYGGNTSEDYTAQGVVLYQGPDNGVMGPTEGNRRCYSCTHTVKAHLRGFTLDHPRFVAMGEKGVGFE